MSALLRAHDSRVAGGLEERGAVRVPCEAAETARPAPSLDLASLYQRHADFVYRLALWLLGSREEAEDLTQDVFASLCGPTAYDPRRGSMRAFLSALTRWRAIDRLRSRVRSGRLLETWPEAAPFGVAPALPWEDVSMRRAAERVRGALAGLAPAQREVLEMAYYRDLSQQEIAAELDAPLGTVKSWSRRALHELGWVLEELRPEAAPGSEPPGMRALSRAPTRIRARVRPGQRDGACEGGGFPS